MLSLNTYKILSDGEEDFDHIDVETVTSELPDIDEMGQDFEKSDNEPAVTIYDLFRAEGNVPKHVSDDEDSNDKN